MAEHRSYSVAFKRQVAEEFIAGETLVVQAPRHLTPTDPDLAWQTIRNAMAR